LQADEPLVLAEDTANWIDVTLLERCKLDDARIPALIDVALRVGTDELTRGGGLPPSIE
jgi:hypothetical protein